MMSVRYTATWYDVTQARQQDTYHTQTRTGPAGRSSVLSRSIAVTGSWPGTVYSGVIGSKWRSSVLLFAADSDCIPIVGAVKP